MPLRIVVVSGAQDDAGGHFKGVAPVDWQGYTVGRIGLSLRHLTHQAPIQVQSACRTGRTKLGTTDVCLEETPFPPVPPFTTTPLWVGG